MINGIAAVIFFQICHLDYFVTEITAQPIIIPSHTFRAILGCIDRASIVRFVDNATGGGEKVSTMLVLIGTVG